MEHEITNRVNYFATAAYCRRTGRGASNQSLESLDGTFWTLWWRPTRWEEQARRVPAYRSTPFNHSHHVKFIDLEAIIPKICVLIDIINNNFIWSGRWNVGHCNRFCIRRVINLKLMNNHDRLERFSPGKAFFYRIINFIKWLNCGKLRPSETVWSRQRVDYLQREPEWGLSSDRHRKVP